MRDLRTSLQSKGPHALFSLLAFFLAGQPGKALDTDKDLTQCRLETWTAKDGLPARTIEAMTQTPDGYLWLATHGGLVRFDGVNFKTFSSANTPGLVHNTILSIAVDAKGTLWLGTDWDGFGKFENGRYTRVQVDPKHPETGWSEYRTLYLSKAGEMWAGGSGSYALVQMKNRKPVSNDEKSADNGILEDRQGNLWIANGQGLTRRNAKGVWLPRHKDKPNLTCLCLDREGSVWAGSRTEGLYRYKDGKFRLFTTKDGLSSNVVQALHCDRQGNLWVGTHLGLNRFLNGKFTSFHRGDGLFSENVTAILEDRESSLWVASGSALNRFTNTALTPLQVSDSTGLASLIWSSPAKDGGIWICTTIGVMKYKNGQMQRVTFNEKRKAYERVNQVFESSDGALWLNLDSTTILRVYRGKTTVIAQNIHFEQMVEDAQGVIGLTNSSVTRFSADGKNTKLRQDEIGFTFKAICDRNGTVWIGCTKGFAKIEKNRVVTVDLKMKQETHVLGITEDSERGLWLSTDRGLMRYRDGRFTVYGKPQGLPDENLFEIQEDGQKRLWVGGRFGIFCVRKADLDALDGKKIDRVNVTLYSGSDGIRSFPYLGSTLKKSNGELWFGGESSLTRVQPDKMTTNPLPPNVLIEQVKNDNNALPPASHLSIEPGIRNTEIAYTGLSLAAPEKMRFRYQLTGYDPNWVEAGNRRSAYYTNLPPGDYTFQVQACNNDGVWNRGGAILSVKVKPHFYQTAGFRVGSVFAIFGTGGLLLHLRLRRFKKIHHLLETRVAQRTAELLQSKHELEDTLEELHASKEELELANARLEALATTDGMTELANHRAFQERLQIETRPQGQTKRMALLLLDVDHFKQYNDAFGHPAGDEALRIVGRIIRENVRKGDFPARYGGEEFAALLPQSSPEGATMVAERIREAIAAHPFPHRAVTVSIGVAFWSTEKQESKSLVQRADDALYRAKRGGRNRISFEEDAEEDPASLPKAA